MENIGMDTNFTQIGQLYHLFIKTFYIFAMQTLTKSCILPSNGEILIN